jgi:hypothetical protein
VHRLCRSLHRPRDVRHVPALSTCVSATRRDISARRLLAVTPLRAGREPPSHCMSRQIGVTAPRATPQAAT